MTRAWNNAREIVRAWKKLEAAARNYAGNGETAEHAVFLSDSAVAWAESVARISQPERKRK